MAEPTLSGGKPITHWVEALKDPDSSIRKNAVRKLGNVGPADPQVLPTVTSALNDQDREVRCEAILALLKCGPDARPAIPALTELQQKDRDPKVRDYAARAMEKLSQGK